MSIDQYSTDLLIMFLRAWKQSASGGVRTYFYYDGDTLIGSESDATGSTSAVYLWGADGLIGSQSRDAQGVVRSSYNLYDAQGNLAQRVDGAGVATPAASYTAWGEVVPRADGTLPGGGGYGAKYGYLFDGESGFYLCTYRHYDPSAGRWITRDPIGYVGGSNLYGYVGNDPMNHIDSLGFGPDDWWDPHSYDFDLGDWKYNGSLATIDGIIPDGIGINHLTPYYHRFPDSIVNPFSSSGYYSCSNSDYVVSQWLGEGARVAVAAYVLSPFTGPVLSRGGQTNVTSWAPRGANPDLAAGRWVMRGGPSIRNYLRSGIKSKGYPFRNSVTQRVPLSRLKNPLDAGPVGQITNRIGISWKGLMGQSILK